MVATFFFDFDCSLGLSDLLFFRVSLDATFHIERQVIVSHVTNIDDFAVTLFSGVLNADEIFITSLNGDRELLPVDPDGSRLTIAQRWSKIEINYWNPESSRSRSVSARIEVGSEIPMLINVYENEPEHEGIRKTQQRHRRTAVLDLYNGDGRKLRGSYYTDHAGGEVLRRDAIRTDR